MSHTDTSAAFPDTGVLAAAQPGTLAVTNVRPYGEGEPRTILIEGGVIADLDAPDSVLDAAGQVLDGAGGVLLPGLVDMHTHLREPGGEETETIATGSAAAARGGYTAVFTMANTQPVIDDPAIAEAVWAKGQQVGLCDVHPVGSITKGLEGTTLTEFGLMARSAARVRMFSDDGKGVENPIIMRRAIEYARGVDVLLAQHCEDPRLTESATAHEGEVSSLLGLRGWPRAAEESMIARDGLLARDYGGRVHVCHASTAGAVAILRAFKNAGIAMTAEVTPHHLLLTDELLKGYDGRYKVNPPLREQSDVEALREALLDGTVDCVATDHAPHAEEDKACEFELARPGMLGMETALAIVAELFVKSGRADWRWVARVMSERPAEITRLPGHGRPIAVGEPANLTIVDEDHEWTVDADRLASKARNTPFAGHTFTTKVASTILRGRVTCQDGKACRGGAQR